MASQVSAPPANADATASEMRPWSSRRYATQADVSTRTVATAGRSLGRDWVTSARSCLHASLPSHLPNRCTPHGERFVQGHGFFRSQFQGEVHGCPLAGEPVTHHDARTRRLVDVDVCACHTLIIHHLAGRYIDGGVQQRRRGLSIRARATRGCRRWLVSTWRIRTTLRGRGSSIRAAFDAMLPDIGRRGSSRWTTAGSPTWHASRRARPRQQRCGGRPRRVRRSRSAISRSVARPARHSRTS